MYCLTNGLRNSGIKLSASETSAEKNRNLWQSVLQYIGKYQKYDHLIFDELLKVSDDGNLKTRTSCTYFIARNQKYIKR